MVFDVDECVGSSEVDADIIGSDGKKFSERFKHIKWDKVLKYRELKDLLGVDNDGV